MSDVGKQKKMRLGNQNRRKINSKHLSKVLFFIHTYIYLIFIEVNKSNRIKKYGYSLEFIRLEEF